jgi:hypothetical protein
MAMVASLLESCTHSHHTMVDSRSSVALESPYDGLLGDVARTLLVLTLSRTASVSRLKRAAMALMRSGLKVPSAGSRTPSKLRKGNSWSAQRRTALTEQHNTRRCSSAQQVQLGLQS